MSIAGRRRLMSMKIQQMRKQFLDMDGQTLKQTIQYLKALAQEIRAATVGAVGWDAANLQMIRAEVERAILRFENRLFTLISENQLTAWQLGINGVDDVLAAAEVDAMVPLLSDAQLLVLRDFSADLVTGLTRDTLGKVNNAVSLGVVGQRSPYETMREVDRILGIEKVKGVTARAEKIARTEVGRAQSIARQLRMEQIAQRVPELRKQWHTGINPREAHARADGQIRQVDEPFDIDGYEAMEPRDPGLPAEQVVNCNCTSEIYLPELA